MQPNNETDFYEQNNLRKNRYSQSESNNKFVIKNKKHGKIAEINAKSVIHACGLLGWRPRHCKVMSVKGENDE